MKVYEIARSTKSPFIIEEITNFGEKSEIVFDSDKSTYSDYKKYEFCPVQLIEPESDGGRKLLHLSI